MISNLGSNLVFSEIEYFTYLNLWLVSLSLLLVIFFLLLSSSLLTIVSIYLNAAWMEFFLTLFSLWFLWLIISPSLIILLEFDLILIPSFIIYSLGYQWAWSFNLSFTLSFLKVLVSNVGTINNVAVMNSFLGILGCSYYFDHYIISSFFLSNCSSYYYPCIFLLSNILSSFYYSQSFCFGLIWGLRNFLSSSSYYFDLGSTLWNWIAVLGTYSIFAFSFSFSSSLYSWQSCCYVPFYLFDINRFLIIPLWTSFKIIVFSFDDLTNVFLYVFYLYDFSIDSLYLIFYPIFFLSYQIEWLLYSL